jgi:hypothetical protein
VVEDVVITSTSDDFFGGIAGESRCPAIPIKDGSVTIDEIDSVVNVEEDIPIEIRIVHEHDYVAFLRRSASNSGSHARIRK